MAQHYLVARHATITDYLNGWDARWGTCCGISPAHAMRFETPDAAWAALERARELVPAYTDGRLIEYRVVPAPKQGAPR
jgi:hypothetical protein